MASSITHTGTHRMSLSGIAKGVFVCLTHGTLHPILSSCDPADLIKSQMCFLFCGLKSIVGD